MNATTIKERPILFNAAMVRAILNGSKTQTRLVLDLPEFNRSGTRGYDWTWRGQAPIKTIKQQQRHPRGCWQDVRHDRLMGLCPYGKPGDRLWVREGVWCYEHTGWTKNGQLKWPKLDMDAGLRWFDKACEWVDNDPTPMNEPVGKLNKMFAPRWASRITLEVTDVRVERVQDISIRDAIGEGIPAVSLYELDCESRNPADGFRDLWDSINAKRGYSWDSNPWVWAVTFKRIGGEL